MIQAKVGPSEGDPNLVEMWVRKDPSRWIAGAMAGIFAAGVMVLFAMMLSTFGSMDMLAPIKVPAVPFLGAEAMRVGVHLPAIAVGATVLLLLSAFLGAVFSHFTYTNKLFPLLGMGLTWGIFSWIFWNNLVFPSWLDYRTLALPKGAMFFSLVVFGISLSSVAFFDRVVRKSPRP